MQVPDLLAAKFDNAVILRGPKDACGRLEGALQRALHGRLPLGRRLWREAGNRSGGGDPRVQGCTGVSGMSDVYDRVTKSKAKGGLGWISRPS